MYGHKIIAFLVLGLSSTTLSSAVVTARAELAPRMAANPPVHFTIRCDNPSNSVDCDGTPLRGRQCAKSCHCDKNANVNCDAYYNCDVNGMEDWCVTSGGGGCSCYGPGE